APSPPPPPDWSSPLAASFWKPFFSTEAGHCQPGRVTLVGMSPGQASRFVARACVIFFLFASASLRWWLGWLVLLGTLRAREARRRWFADCLVRLFRSLGATFIKVGQIMSTRPDLLPPHVIAALETLQDNVGPFPYHLVQRTLVEDLGKPPEEIFAEIAPAP